MPYFGGTCENRGLHLLMFWIYKNFLGLLFLLLIVTSTDFCYLLSYLNKTPFRYLFNPFFEKKSKTLNLLKISIAQVLLNQVNSFVVFFKPNSLLSSSYFHLILKFLIVVVIVCLFYKYVIVS